MKQIFIIFTLILFNLNLRSEEQNYLKEMTFDHIHMGCPANSQCQKEMGTKLVEWRKLLESYRRNPKTFIELQNFINKWGVPIEFLTNIKTGESFPPVLWSSPCKHHQENNIHLAMGFIKKVKENEVEIFHEGKMQAISQNVQLDTINLYLNDKKIKSMFLPFNTRPKTWSNESVVFLYEEEGIYLNIEITKNGELKLVKSKNISEIPAETVECPPITSKYDEKYYLAQSCKKIDIQNKSYIAQSPWSCE